MTILALDTTGEFGSMALLREGHLLAERHLHSPEGFAHVIFVEFAAMLEAAGVTLPEIDCFAVGNGPGSFTGVRVGITAVKGLAEALNKPVAAISNLRALAAFGHTTARAVLLDARRGEVYAGLYDAALQAMMPESVGKLTPWLESMKERTAMEGRTEMVGRIEEFVVVSGSPFEQALQGTEWANLPWTVAPRSLAAAVARCAEMDARRGLLTTALAADANYVRRSDAELFWKER